MSILIAFSCIAYIQEHMGWRVGFGIPALLMLLSAISFLLASPFYIKLKPETSILTGLAQVGVASYRNRDIQLSSSDTIQYYHAEGSIPKPGQKLRYNHKNKNNSLHFIYVYKKLLTHGIHFKVSMMHGFLFYYLSMNFPTLLNLSVYVGFLTKHVLSEMTYKTLV